LLWYDVRLGTGTADHCTRLITMANGQHRSAWVASFEDGREDDDIMTMGMESAAPVDTALIFDAYNNDAFWLPTSEKPHTTGETTDHGLSANGPEPFTAGCSTHGLNGTQQGTQCGSFFLALIGPPRSFTHFRNPYGALPRQRTTGTTAPRSQQAIRCSSNAARGHASANRARFRL
jgi:hypothetical protein